MDHKDRRDLPPSETVHYQIDGKKYDVPLGYHWEEYLKYKRWPTPKEGYANVRHISFTTILPDLEPMTESNRAEFNVRGFGRRLYVFMSSKSSRPRTLDEILSERRQRNELVRLEDDVEGLTHYAHAWMSHDPNKWKDIYVLEDSKWDFWIECSRGVPSPSCHVLQSRPEGPFIDYSFSKKFLHEWRSIDQAVIGLIDSFQVKK